MLAQLKIANIDFVQRGGYRTKTWDKMARRFFEGYQNSVNKYT